MEGLFGGNGPAGHPAGGENPFMSLFRAVTGQAGLENMAADAAAYAGQAAQAAQHVFDPQPPGPSGPPPASTAALRQLPMVTVTAEDLVEPSNRECCICFEENNINDRVVRLPCAHIYHSECITEWLQKHCTCPTCRYELPTDDPHYEAGRRERMRTRKPRYAKYELQRMSVRELKALLPRRTSTRQFTDKTDIVEYIISHQIVDIIATPPPVEFPSLAVLRAMGVGQLKRTMSDSGVFFDPKEVVEKEDMVQIFVNSGRICLTEEETPEEETADVENNYCNMKNYDSTTTATETNHSHHPMNDNTRETEHFSEVASSHDAGTGMGPNAQDPAPANSTSTFTSTPTTRIVVETVGANDDEEILDSHSHNVRSPWASNRVLEQTDFGAQDAAAVAAAASNSAEETCQGLPSGVVDDNLEPNDQQLEGESINEQPIEDFMDVDAEPAMVPEEAEVSTSAATATTSEPVARAPNAQEESTDEEMEIDDSEGSRKRRRQEPPLVGDQGIDIGEQTCQFQNLSISQLRTMAREQGVDVSSCIERGEMIERLSSVSSSGYDNDSQENNNSDTNSTSSEAPTSSNEARNRDPVAEATAASRLSEETFRGWSVSQLRASAQAVDVDLSHCVEQDQMIDRLLIAASERPHVANYLSSLSPLMDLNISQLRALASDWRVSVADCLEKGEIIRRLAVSAVDRR